MAGRRWVDEPAIYQIRVRGTLDPASARTWFEGFRVTALPGGESLLVGEVLDQSALLGLLARIRDLGLLLVSVTRTGNGTLSEEAS